MLDISERASSTDVIHRSYDLDDISFRDDESDEGWFRFDGVASVVDTPYSVRDRFGEFNETIQAGAFTKTLRDSKADVALFVNHQHQAPPLATRSTGRLTLTADPNLRVGAKLNGKRSDVQDTRHAVIDGELRQMSIGFTVPKDRDQWNDDYTERTITEVKLVEVSIVWRGANPHTSASMRYDDLMRSLLDVDMSDDEIRRAIDHLTERITPPVTDIFAERDRLDRERLERKQLLRSC